MIVGIDNITPGTSTSSSLSVGGMRPYVQDLLLGLPPLFPGWQFKFFTPAWNEPFETRGTNVEVVVCDEVSKSRLRRVWFEQTRLPRLIAAHKVDLWLGTCNYLPLLAACRTFLIVQSHQFFTNPEAFGSLRRFFLQWVVTRSVELADRTAVQCEDAKRTLLKYVDMPADSISIVYNRLVDVNVDVNVPDAAPGLSDLIGCDRPYLLYVSGLYPFKNHARLIEAFARIRPRFADLALVLAGGGPDRDLRSEAARHGIQNDVIFLGKVPQPAIPVLYRNALASVFPSLEETFGLPVLEAMSLDCPVLTSNRSSMAEIAGDAAVLVDPESVDELAEGMIRLLTNDSERQKQIERGRARCRYFTKEKTIRSLAAALESVANLEPVQTGLIPGVPIRPAA